MVDKVPLDQVVISQAQKSVTAATGEFVVSTRGVSVRMRGGDALGLRDRPDLVVIVLVAAVLPQGKAGHRHGREDDIIRHDLECRSLTATVWYSHDCGIWWFPKACEALV